MIKSKEEPRILIYDIESAGVNALNADLGYVICFGYKWLGEKETHCISITDFSDFKKNPQNDKRVVKEALKILNEADGIIAHYGNRFDRPYIAARALYHGLAPFPDVQQLDPCYLAYKKFKLSSNRLVNIAKFLKCRNQKMNKDGTFWPDAWLSIMKGSTKNQKKMIAYCKQDVRTLEEIAVKMRPYWFPSFVNSLGYSHFDGTCPACGSDYLMKNGTRKNKNYTYQRMICCDCATQFKGDKV